MSNTNVVVEDVDGDEEGSLRLLALYLGRVSSIGWFVRIVVTQKSSVARLSS
jgi:hypothetical protein